MITFINPDILKHCINEFNGYTNLNLQLSIKNCGSLLPSVRPGRYITYNSHINTLLLLQNIAFKYPSNANNLPYLFYLSYTLIDYNYYEFASETIKELRNNIDALIQFAKQEFDFLNHFIALDCQYLVALYHELCHILFKINPQLKEKYQDVSMNALNDLISSNIFTNEEFNEASILLLKDHHWLEELSCDIWGVHMIYNLLFYNNYNSSYIQEALTQCTFLDYVFLTMSLTRKKESDNNSFKCDFLRVSSLWHSCCNYFQDNRYWKEFYQNMLFFSNEYIRIAEQYEKEYSKLFNLINDGATVPINVEIKKELMSQLSNIEYELYITIDGIQTQSIQKCKVPNPFNKGSKQYTFYDTNYTNNQRT